MKHGIAAIGVATLLLGSGCMGMMYDEWPYRPAGKAYTNRSLFAPDVKMRLPPDWMKLNGIADGLVATGDGFNLHAIKFRRIDIGKRLPHTKKMVAKGMRPDELSEVLLDDVRTDGTAIGLEILDTRPATISGQPGFRANVAFKDPDGLRYRAVLCGVIVGGYAWQLTYVAASRHYFNRDLPEFEKVLASLVID